MRQMERIKRVTRMVAIVVMLFAVCWFPIHLITLWIQFDPNFPRTEAMHYFKLFGHTLSYANSCVNPFVYAFVNDGFRKTILKRSSFLSRLCSCVLSPKPKKDETPMIDKSVEARPGLDGQSDYMTTQTTITLWYLCTLSLKTFIFLSSVGKDKSKLDKEYKHTDYQR